MSKKQYSAWIRAHAAKINDQGYVQQVIVIPYCNDNDEEITIYCNENGLEGTWIDTSYKGSRRGKYAGLGDLWDGTNFISQAPDVDSVTS
jgi:hypothetical protein